MIKYYDLAKTNTSMDLGLEVINVLEKNELNVLRSLKDMKGVTFLETRNYQTLLKAAKKGSVDFINYNSSIDKELLKSMSSTKTILNITFSSVLNSKNNREKIVLDMKKIVKICLKLKTPIILSSWVGKETNLVPYDGLISFGQYLGMNKKQARTALTKFQKKVLKV